MKKTLTLAAVLLCMALALLLPWHGQEARAGGLFGGLSATTTAPSPARWPADPGTRLQGDGKLQVDLTNASDGYFWARLNAANKHRMKMRVVKGDVTLTYDLNSSAEFELFPLQLGDGRYQITLYENVTGKKYANAGTVVVNVTLSAQGVSFLYPNQYVSYTRESKIVNKAEELCAGKNDQGAFDAVCSYMKTSYAYDFVKALTIKAGVLPDIDGSYDKRMGVCQDLAAIMCGMLRTRGIRAKLIIGYADKNYHAWVVCDFGGQEHFFDPTAAINGISKVKTYSVERYY